MGGTWPDPPREGDPQKKPTLSQIFFMVGPLVGKGQGDQVQGFSEAQGHPKANWQLSPAAH